MKLQNVISKKTIKEVRQILYDMGYDVINLNGDHTQVCIFCFKKVVVYTGHVHKRSKTILAGLCKDHRLATLFNAFKYKDCPGCHGDWDEKMGLTYIPFR